MTSITRRVRDILARDSDLMEATKILDAAGEDPEKWSVETLQNADLVGLAIVGIALNRSGSVPYAVQLMALNSIWDRMDGKLTDKTPGAAAEEGARPLMSVEDFRRAILTVPVAPVESPATPVDPDDDGEDSFG